MDQGSRETRASLLMRLRESPGDQSAWAEFAGRYGPRITAWCRRWGLQEADAHDVTQSVLIQMAVKLRSFVYDPDRSFRGWLRRLTRNAWCDFVSERQRAGAGAGDSRVAGLLLSVEARDDLERRLEEAYDLELLELAQERVRLRVEGRTWEAFRLTALEGRLGAEAAGLLGMQVTAVYMAKSNVMKLIREELRRLDGEET